MILGSGCGVGLGAELNALASIDFNWEELLAGRNLRTLQSLAI